VACFPSPTDWYRYCEVMRGTYALLLLEHDAQSAPSG
jgi:hypothetical protein